MSKDKQNAIDFLKNKNYLIALLVAVVLLVVLWIYMKPSASNLPGPNATSNNVGSTSSISENAKAILEKYNLEIKEFSGKRLVITDPQQCTIFIYPDILDNLASSIKSEYKTSIMEEDTNDRYIYIGETTNPNGVTIYKLLVYFKDDGIGYVTICNLQKINQTYLPAADELLKAYKELTSK